MRSKTFRASSPRTPARGSDRNRRGIALSRRSRPPRIPFCTGCIETLPYEISSLIVAIVRLPRNTLRPRFAVNPRPEATFASSISYHRENTIQEKCCSGKMPFRINGIPIVFAAMPGTPAGEKGGRRLEDDQNGPMRRGEGSSFRASDISSRDFPVSGWLQPGRI